MQQCLSNKAKKLRFYHASTTDTFPDVYDVLFAYCVGKKLPGRMPLGDKQHDNISLSPMTLPWRTALYRLPV